MDPIDFHSLHGGNILWKSMVLINCSVTDILQNIVRVQQKKETNHTGFEQLEDEYDDRIFNFESTIPLS